MEHPPIEVDETSESPDKSRLLQHVEAVEEAKLVVQAAIKDYRTKQSDMLNALESDFTNNSPIWHELSVDERGRVIRARPSTISTQDWY